MCVWCERARARRGVSAGSRGLWAMRALLGLFGLCGPARSDGRLSIRSTTFRDNNSSTTTTGHYLDISIIIIELINSIDNHKNSINFSNNEKKANTNKTKTKTKTNTTRSAFSAYAMLPVVVVYSGATPTTSIAALLLLRTTISSSSFNSSNRIVISINLLSWSRSRSSITLYRFVLNIIM